MADIKENWSPDDNVTHIDINAWSHRINKSAFVFVQQTDPEITDPDMTGPAIWYVTDGTENVIDVRIRTS